MASIDGNAVARLMASGVCASPPPRPHPGEQLVEFGSRWRCAGMLRSQSLLRFMLSASCGQEQGCCGHNTV